MRGSGCAGWEGCLDYRQCGVPGGQEPVAGGTSVGRRGAVRLAIGELGCNTDLQAKTVGCARARVWAWLAGRIGGEGSPNLHPSDVDTHMHSHTISRASSGRQALCRERPPFVLPTFPGSLCGQRPPAGSTPYLEKGKIILQSQTRMETQMETTVVVQHENGQLYRGAVVRSAAFSHRARGSPSRKLRCLCP